MIDKLFKDLKGFSVVFFIAVIFDIVAKIAFTDISIRFISMPLVMLLLMVFYFKSNKCPEGQLCFVMFGLMCFLFGRFFLANDTNEISVVIGMALFALAKTFYGIRFFNQKDFRIDQVAILLFCCFGYMSLLLYFVYDKLGMLLVPSMVYCFISFLLILLAFLRREDVHYRSYLLVFFGVIFSFISEGFGVVDIFEGHPYAIRETLVTLTFGLFQYLVIIGLVLEKPSTIAKEEIA